MAGNAMVVWVLVLSVGLVRPGLSPPHYLRNRLSSSHYLSRLSFARPDVSDGGLRTRLEMGSGVVCRISLREAAHQRIPIGKYRRGKHKTPNRVPNNHWRAVPWKDLREHPLVDPLPAPWKVKIESAKDLRKLRRDSRRFIRIHHGRLTTFNLPTLLGLFEPAASDYLRIRRPLAGRHDKALHVREELIESRSYEVNENLDSYVTLAQSLAFMDEELEEEVAQSQVNENLHSTVWHDHFDPNNEFAKVFSHMYSPVPVVSRDELDPDLDVAIHFGEAQQATGVLTALNVLAKEGCRIKENGLFPLEALDDPDLPSFPFPIGAVPDAMISWPDGREEPLVIKTTSPFEVYKGSDGYLRTRLNRNSRPSRRVTSWHVPQIQLQMLCTGASEGWLLYMSGLNGARLFRIQRDDAYIKQMAFWINKFASLYGSRAPPENFFLTENYESYRAFLTKTKKIASRAFQFAIVKQRWIQRSGLNSPFFVGDLEGEDEDMDDADYSDYNKEADYQLGEEGKDVEL